MIWWLSVAWAESWCAGTLVAHEWGVTVLGAQVEAPAEPSWLEARQGDLAPVAPVRAMQPDSGERELPVVHFYDSRGSVGERPRGQ